MTEIDINFEWARDLDGEYELVEASDRAGEQAVVDHPLGKSVYPGRDEYRRLFLLARSGRFEPYVPLKSFPTLFGMFSELETPEDVRTFVRKFGPLTHEGFYEGGDPVGVVLEHAGNMREVRQAAAGEKLKGLIGHRGVPFGNVQPILFIDVATERPSLKLTPKTLLDALWLQLARTLESGSVLRRCRLCDEWFGVGPGTVHPLHTKFCKKAHQRKFNSLKRSKRPNEGR